MYAEQFNAPSWLETPSQWLWWAMQSRINGNLVDAQYNIQQFWSTLEDLKKTATEATWPEIIALDSQSHIQAANILGLAISTMLQNMNAIPPWIAFWGWSANSAQEAISKAQTQRASELALAASLAKQAQTAQTQRVEAVTNYRITQDEADRARENTDINRIIRSNSMDWLGIPFWAWALGGIAVGIILFRRR